MEIFLSIVGGVIVGLAAAATIVGVVILLAPKPQSDEPEILPGLFDSIGYSIDTDGVWEINECSCVEACDCEVYDAISHELEPWDDADEFLAQAEYSEYLKGGDSGGDQA